MKVFELSNGGCLELDDDNTIRYIDSDGNFEGVWRPGDEDYDNYLSYFN